jgi:hypothetical protein
MPMKQTRIEKRMSDHETRIVPHDYSNCHTARHAEGGDCSTRYEVRCSCGWAQGARSRAVADAIAVGHRNYSPDAAIIVTSNISQDKITDNQLRDDSPQDRPPTCRAGEVAASAPFSVAQVREIVTVIIEDAIRETVFIDDLKDTMADALVAVVADRVAEQLTSQRGVIVGIGTERDNVAEGSQRTAEDGGRGTAGMVELCRAIDDCPQVMASGVSMSKIDADWWAWLRRVQAINDQVRRAQGPLHVRVSELETGLRKACDHIDDLHLPDPGLRAESVRLRTLAGKLR